MNSRIILDDREAQALAEDLTAWAQTLEPEEWVKESDNGLPDDMRKWAQKINDKLMGRAD